VLDQASVLTDQIRNSQTDPVPIEG